MFFSTKPTFRVEISGNLVTGLMNEPCPGAVTIVGQPESFTMNGKVQARPVCETDEEGNFSRIFEDAKEDRYWIRALTPWTLVTKDYRFPGWSSIDMKNSNDGELKTRTIDVGPLKVFDFRFARTLFKLPIELRSSEHHEKIIVVVDPSKVHSHRRDLSHWDPLLTSHGYTIVDFSKARNAERRFRGLVWAASLGDVAALLAVSS